jgi:hypothetical protein
MATPVTVSAANGGAWSLQSVNSALQGRLHDGAGLMQTASMATWRDGVFAAIGTEFQLTALGSPNQTVNVAAGSGVATRTGQGPYVMWSTPTTNVPLDAAHATLARIDVVYARPIDNVFTEGAEKLTFGVLTGTPSGSPAVPSLATAFPNAPVLKLGEIAVPSLATRPSNQVQTGDITDKRRAAGHFDGVRRLIAGDALADAGFRTGELRDSTDLSGGIGLERWNGSGWDTLSFVGSWIPWTPTMTGMLNNAGTFVARYRRIGKAVWGNVKFNPAATANLGTGTPIISLPFQATSAAAGLVSCTGRFLDASGNNKPIWAFISPSDTGISILGMNTSFVYASPGSAGFTWNNSSELEVTFGPYECV